MVLTSMKQDIESIKKSLINSGLGLDLTDEELNEVAGIAVELHFKKGKTIIKEDSNTRDLFILNEGQVSVRMMLPTIQFKEEVLTHISAPAIFGEFSLANGAPRSATVSADIEMIVYKLEYDQLVKLMENNYRIGYVLMRNLAAIIANRIRDNHRSSRNLMLGW
ncbi:MAG: cyclic nucleotide-binding domain-containing protein [Candidatus Hatepunaea meridiana]|nr:cyclic nucleotide-binding domain-containing protein [Candidatus Hatepunaea meridiana]